jgi:multidrug efflux pump
MMCSKFLKVSGEGKFPKFVNHQFGRLEKTYSKALHGGLDNLSVAIVFSIIVLSSLYFLYSNSKSELAPQEDQGFVFILFL